MSAFTDELVKITVKSHDDFHLHDENDGVLGAEIRRIWKNLGFTFPGVKTAWSAVFVSDCVKRAGATATEFKFAISHAKFVFAAIENQKAGTGVFRAVRITDPAAVVKPGDIIHNNRLGQKINYNFAAKHDDYFSHSAIVVKTDSDTNGKFAITVGGNESNSIRMKRVELDGNGRIVQRDVDPYISVIKNLK